MRRLALLSAAVLAIAAAPADARKHEVVPQTFAAMPPPPPAPVPVANGSIFQVDQGYAGLYEGARAKRVGDPLTIVLVEQTAASKTASSKLDSTGGFGITPPSAGPLAINPGALKLGGNRGFDGKGQSDQANSLSGQISVTVAVVYPNGTMLVQGQKRVTLNRGDEFLQIRGLVRTADVDADNRVLSTRVADAEIAYTGKGDVARASRQGWLSRFFSVISPF